MYTWNGYGYECYLCHRVFHQIHSLSQHLNSPARKSPVILYLLCLWPFFCFLHFNLVGGNENGTDRRGSCGF